MVKKTYMILVEGGTKAFITHIKVNKLIMSYCQMKEEAMTGGSLIIPNRHKIAVLNVSDPQANLVEIDNLVETNCKLQDTVRTLQKDVFDYLEKLLSPELAVKWWLICSNHRIKGQGQC